MKQIIRKWVIRLSATGLLSMGMLVGVVLNPTILYANKTKVANLTVYHNGLLDNAFYTRLSSALHSIKKSSLYNKDIALDICLDDGSYYPRLMEKVRGRAFGWGFSDIVVLRGETDYQANTVEISGYRWNLAQLIAHEATHCLQFMRWGFWGSNPIAGYPHWKWEGYAEYISRKSAGQRDLVKNIARKIEQEQADPKGWAINFSDNTIAPRRYYLGWLLMQYCLDIKKMKYEPLLHNDAIDQASVEEEMMNWYYDQIQTSDI